MGAVVQAVVNVDDSFRFTEAGVAVNVQTGVLVDRPEPLRLTLCGLPAEDDITITLPVLVPVAVGVNVTLMLHEPLVFKPEPQLCVVEKFPPAEMLYMISEASPVLVRVTV